RTGRGALLTALLSRVPAGAGVVEKTAVRGDLETEGGRLGVQDSDAGDIGDGRADEGALFRLVGGELALGLHRGGGGGDGVRLLDDRVLLRGRRLRAAAIQLGREEHSRDRESGDERDESEAAGHPHVI